MYEIKKIFEFKTLFETFDALFHFFRLFLPVGGTKSTGFYHDFLCCIVILIQKPNTKFLFSQNLLISRLKIRGNKIVKLDCFLMQSVVLPDIWMKFVESSSKTLFSPMFVDSSQNINVDSFLTVWIIIFCFSNSYFSHKSFSDC